MSSTLKKTWSRCFVYLQIEADVDSRSVLEISLPGTPQDEDGAGDPREQMRADAQLLGRAVAREIMEALIVLSLEHLTQINVL